MCSDDDVETSLNRSCRASFVSPLVFVLKHCSLCPHPPLPFCLQSIVDNKVQGMEKLCMSCVQLALHRWQLLPRVHTGCGAHKPLLHLFHQVTACTTRTPYGEIHVSTLNMTCFYTHRPFVRSSDTAFFVYLLFAIQFNSFACPATIYSTSFFNSDLKFV